MASTTSKDPSLHSAAINDFPSVIPKADNDKSINWESLEGYENIFLKSCNKPVKKTGLKTLLLALSNKVVFGHGVVCSF